MRNRNLSDVTITTTTNGNPTFAEIRALYLDGRSTLITTIQFENEDSNLQSFKDAASKIRIEDDQIVFCGLTAKNFIPQREEIDMGLYIADKIKRLAQKPSI